MTNQLPIIELNKKKYFYDILGEALVSVSDSNVKIPISKLMSNPELRTLFDISVIFEELKKLSGEMKRRTADAKRITEDVRNLTVAMENILEERKNASARLIVALHATYGITSMEKDINFFMGGSNHN